MSRTRTCPRLPTMLAVLLAGSASAWAQAQPDPRIADLVATARLRVGLFASQFTRDPTTGAPRSVRVDLAQALARRLGVEVEFLPRRTPLDIVECLRTGACDLVFLPYDERAASAGDFSNPVLLSEYTLLVPAGSPIRSLADADAPGARIAAVRSHASTATLIGLVKHAQILQGEDESAALQLLRSGQAAVLASTRQALLKAVSSLPGTRVLDGRYGANINRIVVPKGRAGWLAAVNEFVEHAKSSGLVQQAIDRDGNLAFQVPPPGDPG